MPDPEDLDASTADRIRRFADAGLADFDPQRVVAHATETSRRPYGRIAVAVTAAAAALLVSAVVFGSLGRGDPPVGASEPTATSTDPTPSMAAPSLPLDPPQPSGAPTGGLTRTEAIEAARRAAPHAADYPEVIRADAGPFGTEAMGFESLEDIERPADSRWVWVIMLCEGCGPLSGQGTFVILDYLDGRVYGIINFRG